MNEFVAKKLAEVQAFSQLASVILQRSGESFVDAAPHVATELRNKEVSLGDLIDSSELQTVFEAKTQKTIDKLTKMMELYIGDEWDNPVEVLEWLSFFSGSAASHAALVASALGASGHDGQSQLADISASFWTTLETVRDTLASIGAERVQQG